MGYWLVKSEPSSWSWDQQVAKGAKGEAWTGVRNFTARQNLVKMKKGDHAFLYHSNEGKEIVGIAEIIKEAYPDPSDKTGRGDTAWPTRFWSVGARTQYGALVLIAQGMDGMTAVTARPGLQALTDYKAAFLLASYDLDDLGLPDFRAGLREDVFQTRRVQIAPSPFSEDGNAFTASLSWQGYDWLRLTGEVIALNSRRGEYTNAGLGSPVRHDTQFQFSVRFFY